MEVKGSHQLCSSGDGEGVSEELTVRDRVLAKGPSD